MIRITAQAKEGAAQSKRQPSPWEDQPHGQPDPVTLCEPTFDDSGRLRWGSTKS